MTERFLNYFWVQVHIQVYEYEVDNSQSNDESTIIMTGFFLNDQEFPELKLVDELLLSSSSCSSLRLKLRLCVRLWLRGKLTARQRV